MTFKRTPPIDIPARRHTEKEDKVIHVGSPPKKAGLGFHFFMQNKRTERHQDQESKKYKRKAP